MHLRSFVFLLVLVIGQIFLLRFLNQTIDQTDTVNDAQTKRLLQEDIQYFPIPRSASDATKTYSYEDSWMNERTYGGERVHEGTDIMMSQNVRGVYPVCSMTDGIVEQMGWLKLGGYRIGVRSANGIYFYYAHLQSYAENLVVGDAVLAGELLGYAGDSGYSEVEGTTGNFPVHLHLGIYIKNQDKTEQSINPYPYLKEAEEHLLMYSY